MADTNVKIPIVAGAIFFLLKITTPPVDLDTSFNCRIDCP